MKRAILFIGLFFIIPNISSAADQGLDRKQVYDLQVQCKEQSETFFRQWYPSISWKDNDGANWTANFNNHYNKKLNKCFITTTATSFIKRKGKLRMEVLKYLSDVNENKEYGIYNKIDNTEIGCKLLERFCESQSQWELLVKPYMEE